MAERVAEDYPEDIEIWLKDSIVVEAVTGPSTILLIQKMN